MMETETETETEDKGATVQARFKSDDGQELENALELPIGIDRNQLELILNALLRQVIISISSHV